MTLKHRRIMYISFFILFFVLAPIVILYTQGYKFDWHKKQMVKTGVLFLETKPTKAEIYLDNKLQEQKTTTRLARLLPKEYNVKISKEGFKAWEKKLTVYPNATTFAQYIRLFRQEPEIKNLLEKKIIMAQYTQDGSTAALVSQEADKVDLNIFNLHNQQVVNSLTLARGDYKVDDIIWSKEADKIIIQLHETGKTDQTIFLLYNPNNKTQLENLYIVLGQTPQLAKFSDFDSNFIYFQTGNPNNPTASLQKYNLITKEIINVKQTTLSDFYFYKNNVYGIIQDTPNKISQLMVFSLAEPEKEHKIISLPLQKDYQIRDIHNDLVSIYSQTTENIYLIHLDKNGYKMEENSLIQNVKGMSWHNNHSILAWWNDFELWVWQVEQKDSHRELLTRISSVIEKAVWYPVETHLAYLTEGKLRIIELISHAGVRESVEIFEAQQISQPIFNNKGDGVYFNGQITEQEGLFELIIQ